MDDAVEANHRPGTATKRETRRLLTADLVIAQGGDYDLYSMKELIMRGEELEGLDEGCAASLASLEILSLSHNRLPSLEHFQHLVNLIELNLNFNRITSLEHLQCTGLEKLFVAGNSITDISPLRRLLQLNTISLYGNQVADLDAALHTCRGLPQLRALDLGGNPCSRELEGYKFCVIRVLPRLKTLDGDQITSLDKELAEEFAVRGGNYTNLDGTAARKRGSHVNATDVRPMTAPVRSMASRRPLEPPSATAFDPFGSADMPRGNVRLFRDDFLNNNPILLEYLVDGVHGESPLEADGAVQAARSKFNDEPDDYSSDDDHQADDKGRRRRSGDAGRGFVGRMRTANPLVDGSGAKAVPEEERSDDEETVRPGTSGVLTRPTTAASASPAPLTSSLGVDPSDPKTTARKLLKHIEVLMETIASYKNRELDSCREALLAENKQLRIENNNIPVLRSEVGDLKKQLAMLQSGSGSAMASEATCQRIQALEKENTSLKREIAQLKQSLLSQQQDSDLQPSSGRTNRVNGTSTASSVGNESTSRPPVQVPEASTDPTARLANSTLLDESAEVDVELTELILQNEVALELIRNGIKSTKREWEEHFQHAKQLERNRVRPSTSLGLAPSGSRGAFTPPTSSDAAATDSARAKPRQLHTSAGGRSGPGEHLLRPPMPVAVYSVKPAKGSDSPDILTL